MPLLEGLDGVNKMSKSYGNYVGINEPPKEIFGKLMSISDTLMWRYYELLSFRSNEEIARYKEEITDGRNPRDVKVLLAQEIVERFHSRQAAEEALADFEARFVCLNVSAFGLSPLFLQSAYFRPHARSEDVDGLYFAGAGTHPGGGVPIVLTSGRLAAETINAERRSLVGA